MRYLIIGNSVAGLNAVSAIREIDKKNEIMVFSEEKYMNYSKPLISYYLAGKLGIENMAFKEDNFYQENKIKLFLTTPIRKIEVKNKKVLTEDKKFSYDKLLIATGGKPIIPSIEGLDEAKKGVFTFTTLDDAIELKKYIEQEKIKDAVVLGGGLIGLKCTEGLLENNINTIIIELSNRILANTFDKNASLIVEKYLLRKNCKVIKENTIKRVFSLKGKIQQVELQTGDKIKTNLLIIAVGVKPNLKLIEETGIKTDKGILVSEYLQTNVNDIFAAGDVAEAKDFLFDTNSTIAIWPVAAKTGKIAGYNMAGIQKKYDGSFIMNSVQIGEIPTISFGITNKQEGYEILEKIDLDRNYYRKIVLKENFIVGAIFVGKIERAGIFSGLIKNKVNVGKIKDSLLNDDFGLLILPEEYRKHIVKGEGIEV